MVNPLFKPDLDASRAMLLALLGTSLQAQAAGRFEGIGEGYAEAYDLLTLGRHEAVRAAKLRDAVDGGTTLRGALIKLEAFKISMGADFDPLFAALEFLEHWMAAAEQGLLQLPRQQLLWREDAEYVLHALEHGAAVDLDGIRV